MDKNIKFIIFKNKNKNKNKSLKLRILDDADVESLLPTISYCLKFRKNIEKNISLNQLKRILKYDTQLCDETVYEESFFVDLQEIDEYIIKNIDMDKLDEELILRFNDITIKRKYNLIIDVIMIVMFGLGAYIAASNQWKTLIICLYGVILIFLLIIFYILAKMLVSHYLKNNNIK